MITFTHCPFCRKELQKGYCKENDHSFSGFNSEDFWYYYDNKVKIQVGKCYACPYYVMFVLSKEKNVLIPIDYVGIENCVEVIEKYSKFKSFV